MFSGATNLSNVTIGNNTINIGTSAFQGCSGIAILTIGSDVASIGTYTFQGCSNLTSIIIPNNVATIGNSAFQECSKITAITLGSSVSSIGVSAFQDCSLLNNITISSNSITSIGTDAFNGLSSAVTIFGNIPNNMFNGATNLSNVTIGHNTTNIGTSAFQGCSGISIVTIGANVASIGTYAFQGCSQLASIIIPNNVTTIGNSAFQECSKITAITLGTRVNSIGVSAFQDCTILFDIEIQSSLITYVGTDAFYGLPTTITISGNIPATMFNNITSLITVYLASNITHISAYTFQNCSGLTNIYLPNISSIEPSAFDGCGSLNIYTSPSNTYISNNMSKFPVDSILLNSDSVPHIIPTEISSNKITGTAAPNSTIIISEKSIDNQEITYQIQTNEQGIWYFNITVPSNTYLFKTLNATQYDVTLQNNFSAKYFEKSYNLTTGVPATIKPRIYETNPFDSRWWRISPALPVGLKLSKATGTISGTPMAAMPPTKYTITSNSQIYLFNRMEIEIEIV